MYIEQTFFLLSIYFDSWKSHPLKKTGRVLEVVKVIEFKSRKSKKRPKISLKSLYSRSHMWCEKERFPRFLDTKGECSKYISKSKLILFSFSKPMWIKTFHHNRNQAVAWITNKCEYDESLHRNTGLVSSGVSLTLWGEVASFAVFGHSFSDGITVKIPCGVDVLLYLPASHPAFSYWVGWNWI